MAALNHPNICTLYDVGPDYLVMEYVEGSTLADRIEKESMPLAEALKIARQMAAALEEAHQNGIVHRDFKPGNVKLKPNGAPSGRPTEGASSMARVPKGSLISTVRQPTAPGVKSCCTEMAL